MRALIVVILALALLTTASCVVAPYPDTYYYPHGYYYYGRPYGYYYYGHPYYYHHYYPYRY